MTLTDFFVNPSLVGIILAIVFGLVWTFPLAPQKLKTLAVWGVFLGGAIVFSPAIVYIQIPLQTMATSFMSDLLGQSAQTDLIYITVIPAILLSGLVQEGAKLIPTVIYWQYHGQKIDPKLGLSLGAMAGAGFGIIEAQWIHNLIFASGWTLDLAAMAGITAFAGFWERFFTVGFHISIGALAGWGLAKGYSWQFYLIASAIHGILNYGAILMATGALDMIQVELIIAIMAVIVFGVVLRLRWKKNIKNVIEEEQPKDIQL